MLLASASGQPRVRLREAEPFANPRNDAGHPPVWLVGIEWRAPVAPRGRWVMRCGSRRVGRVANFCGFVDLPARHVKRDALRLVGRGVSFCYVLDRLGPKDTSDCRLNNIIEQSFEEALAS